MTNATSSKMAIDYLHVLCQNVNELKEIMSSNIGISLQKISKEFSMLNVKVTQGLSMLAMFGTEYFSLIFSEGR